MHVNQPVLTLAHIVNTLQVLKMKQPTAAIFAFFFSLFLTAHAKPISEEPSRVYYQVYVRAFFDGSTTPDGQGDFAGLKSKLGYLKDLGVDTLLLMPIFKNTGGMGYIPQSYESLDAAYGSEQDLKALTFEAKQLGMKIVIDAPVNHISDSSYWFEKANSVECEGGSALPSSNAYCDFFYFEPAPCSTVPYMNWHKPWNWKNTTCSDVWFPYWNHNPEKHRNEKYYATFFQGMPDLKFWDFKTSEWNKPVRDAVTNSLKKWTQLGVDGFRIDAAKHFVESETTNENALEPRNLELLAHFSSELKSVNADVTLLAEAWDNYSVVDSFIGTATDAALDFPFMESLRSSLKNENSHAIYSSLKHLEKTQSLYGPGKRVAFSANHDVSRLATEFTNEEKIKAAHLIALLNVNSPLIFYGEELGMEGKVKRPDPEDPNDNEEYVHTVFAFPWHGDSQNVGFPGNQIPLVGVPSNFKVANLKTAEANPKSIYHHIKKILEIRRKFEVTSDTQFVVLETFNSHSIAWALKKPNGQCLVTAINISGEKSFKLNLKPQIPECFVSASTEMMNSLTATETYSDFGKFGYVVTLQKP